MSPLSRDRHAKTVLHPSILENGRGKRFKQERNEKLVMLAAFGATHIIPLRPLLAMEIESCLEKESACHPELLVRPAS